MSYNSRTNLASPDGDIPNEEFLKVFTQACNIGWQNIKKKPREQCCEFIEKNGELCYQDASEVPVALVEPDEKGLNKIIPKKLCTYHANIIRKYLDGKTRKTSKKP